MTPSAISGLASGGAALQFELPRIREIRKCLRNPASPRAYFHNFDSSIVEEPVKRKHWLHIEAELAGLDAVAWEHLKNGVIPLFETPDESRGWQGAFDKLNEAKAYNYLVRIGCKQIQFVPESADHGVRTPDLQGRLGATLVLCEAKTINISEIAAGDGGVRGIGNITRHLPEGFLRKLVSTVSTAKTQLNAGCPGDGARKLVYVVLNFDDCMNEYVDDYVEQIRVFFTANPPHEAELVFDVKPKYYAATSNSTGSQLFACSTDGTWMTLPEATA